MEKFLKLEGKIKAIARRYARNSAELEDLVQIGKIAIWKTNEVNPTANNSYLLYSAKWAMLGEKTKQRAQKRGGHMRKVPFNSRGEEDFAPEEYLSSPNQIIEEEMTPVTQEEMIKFLKGALKKKFGRTYLHKINKRRGPKDIPRKVVRTLVEKIWNFIPEEIPQKVDYKLFADSKMDHFLWAFYRNSPMKAIQDAYPGVFFEWEFKRVPIGFWDGEQGYRNSQEAIRWIAQKYGFSGGKQRIEIGYEHFIKHGLGVMLDLHFNSSPPLALQSIFPEITPWQTKRTPGGYFDSKDNQLTAVNSVLQSLGMIPFNQLTKEEVYDQGSRKIRQKHFFEKGLRGLLEKHGKGMYRMFNSLYPGKSEPWFFTGNKSHKEPVEEMASRAIKWLFEDYLQIRREEIPKYATDKLFWRLGFSGILTRRDLGLSSSPYRAVNLAYPGEFSKDDFDAKRYINYIPGLKDFRGKYQRKVLPTEIAE